LSIFIYNPKHNQADQPDGRADAVYRKRRASLEGIWPAGYPQVLGASQSQQTIPNQAQEKESC